MAKKNFNFKKLDLGGLKDVLTDTISTVADKVLDFADTAADTAKAGQQIAKLYMEKKKEETALKDAYAELGRLYYELHKPDAEGELADLCMEIENTLVNIQEISEEIEALKESSGADYESFLEDEDFQEEAEDEDFLERMADNIEDAFEGLDEAIEAALDKLDTENEPEDPSPDDAELDDSIEVTVEEYLDDDDFAAPQPDEDVEVEIIVEETP